MGKNFIHGFAGNFAKEYDGPNFVAMGPAYAQWNVVDSYAYGAGWSTGSGYGTLTSTTTFFVQGSFSFQMLAVEAQSTITASISFGGMDPGKEVLFTMGTSLSVNGSAVSGGELLLTQASSPLSGTLSVPYYRYRINFSVDLFGEGVIVGSWLRLDVALS